MSVAFSAFVALLALLMVLRVPIALSMIAGTIGYLIIKKQDTALVADQIMNSLFNSQPLLAIPLFMLAANLMMAGSISNRMFAAARVASGRRPGGLAQGVVLMGAVFASMSGTALGDAASIGRMSVRALVQQGYPRGFAAAVTSSASILGPLIPPSIPLLLYALMANASVGALFLGAVMPGLLIAAALLVFVGVSGRMRQLPANTDAPGQAGAVLLRALPPLGMPLVLLAGIYGGAFTVTEAAAMAAAYTVVLATVVYRELPLPAVARALAATAHQTAVIMLLVCGAMAVNYVVTAEQLDKTLAIWVSSMGLTPLAFLLIVIGTFLVLGCFVDATTLLLVLVPILVPAASALGVDLVHFGVVVVAIITLGVLTPPFGLVLFVISSLTDVPQEEIMREIWGPVAAALAVIIFTAVAPSMVLWLPRVFGVI